MTGIFLRQSITKLLRQWQAVAFGLLAVAGGAALGLLAAGNTDLLLLAGGVVGLLVVVLTLLNPELGLLALVLMTYLRLSDILVHNYSAPSLAKIFVPLLLGIVGLQWVLFGQTPSGWQRPAVLIAQYGLVAVASLLYTTDFGRTQAGVISYVKDSLIVVAVTLLLQRKTTLRRAVWALLAAGIIMGTLSVIQQLTGDFENTYGGFAVASVKNIVGSSSDYRIGGPVKSPNFYALILVPLVPLALNRLWEEESAWRRGVAGWAAAVCILSIIFTFSRGGFLALVVVLGLTFVRRSLRPLTVLATVAALALLVQFVPAQYVARLSTLGDVASGNVEQEVSFRGRSSEIIVAWRMFADHPFTGVGYNDFKTHYLRYSEQLGLDPRSEDRSAHSLYLEVAAETGLLGLFSLGAILWAMFKGLYQARKQLARAGLPDYAGLVEAYGIGLIGYLTGSLFLHMAFPRFFWLLVGIALVVPHVAAVETQPQRRRAVAGQPAGMGLPVKL